MNSKHLLAIALALIGAVANASTNSTLYFSGGPDSYVAPGETKVIRSGAFNFNSPSMNPFFFYIDINDSATNPVYSDVLYYTVVLRGPDGEPLHVGAYENAEREGFASAGRPGFEFDAEYRGDNTLTGRFDILAIGFGADMSLTSLAVDFTQFDEGVQAARIDGSLRFNSDIPIAALSSVPEPTTLAGMLGGLALLAGRATRRRRVSSKLGESACRGRSSEN